MTMKVFISMISVIAVTVVVSACKITRPPGNAAIKNTTAVIAHRGAFKKNNFPENSIASLREAIRLGCAGSEFDVRMTADDSMVINHDPAYHKLEIEKSTYAQLIAFPLSNGEKIPTLREYLLAGKTNNPATKLVVEIKPSGMGKERAQHITDAVVTLIEKLELRKNVVYISFDYEMVKRVHALDPKAHTIS
jgi:glycerophosphoryl diester phosphodiesterase